MRVFASLVVIAACVSPPSIAAPRPATKQTVAPAPRRLPAPPAELVRTWSLSKRYVKHVAVRGFPILGSKDATDAALREAAYLIEQMIGHRKDVLDKLVANHVRFVVMAPTELTTDVPEHSDLEPKDYWDRRARGLGATSSRPAVSCGEENLLNLVGDPYSTENILVHEFAHAIHQMAMSELDATFDKRLIAAFDAAKKAKRWANTYAVDNYMEYWAEGAQSWFDTNRTNDAQHGVIGTRAQLVVYDPPLAALLDEVFGDRPWRYRKIADREPAGRAHLAGWTAKTARTFAWPDRVANTTIDRMTDGVTSAPPAAPSGLALVSTVLGPSPASATKTSMVFSNHRTKPVVVEWIDFANKPVTYATLAPGNLYTQDTYVGHVWRVVESGRVLGYASAPSNATTVDIR